MDNETKTLLEYLPPFLREYYEFKQLCKSGDIEVSSIDKAVDWNLIQHLFRIAMQPYCPNMSGFWGLFLLRAKVLKIEETWCCCNGIQWQV